MSDSGLEGQLLTEKDALAAGKTVVDLWLEKIALAKSDEEEWRQSALDAADVYEAAKDKNSAFNIYHANVETIIPSLYNSTPIPDVRRRYDPDPLDEAEFAGLPPEQQQMAMQQAQATLDAQAKLSRNAAEMTERALLFSVDDYNFDDVMEDTVRDAQVTGRGVPRIRRYSEPDRVKTELVPWNRFVRGPGISWEVVPWVAFRHDLTRPQVEQIIGDSPDKDRMLAEIGFTSPREDGQEVGTKPNETKHAGVLKTIPVYEIWSKSDRSAIFITSQYKSKPLAVLGDELGLKDFFPVPKPLQFVRRLASQVPICPYDVYAPLIKEIDKISRRITALIEQLKIKGSYDAKMFPDFKQLEDADDGKFIPSSSGEQFVGGTIKLEDCVVYWPIEQIIKVITALYEQRESVKQTIFEVMGVSDILRGQVDPREKLGQSEIKAQSGSLRLKRSQAEVARLARDLFRMKAEVIHNHFTKESLSEMTSMRVSDEMIAHIRSNARTYSIDIEADSTVRADMSRFQDELNAFLNGTAQMAQAATGMAPVMPKVVPALLEVYAEFASRFNLGKKGEQALDRLAEASKEPIQDPNQAAQQAQAEAEQQRSQMEGEKYQREMELKDKEMEMKDREMAHKERSAELDYQIKTLDLEAKQIGMQYDMQSKDNEFAHKSRMAGLKEQQAEATEHDE